MDNVKVSQSENLSFHCMSTTRIIVLMKKAYMKRVTLIIKRMHAYQPSPGVSIEIK